MHHCIFVNAFVPILMLFCCLTGVPAATAAAPPCDPAPSLALGETLRVSDLAADLPSRFAVELPVSGFLAVEVSGLASESGVPWVALAGDLCSPASAAAPIQVLARSLSRQIVLAEAGSYQIEVGSVPAVSPSTPIKLTTRFVGLPRLGVARSLSAAASVPVALPPNKDGDSDGEDTEESVNEILPFTAPPPASLAGTPDILEIFLRTSGCGASGESGDDAMVCAQLLAWNEPEAGVLGNAWGDDHDYYRFTLDRTRIVRVSTSGATDTLGSLYDEHGQRVVVDDDGGEGENFALGVLLGSGEYWIRVEGALGAEGEYGLILERK